MLSCLLNEKRINCYDGEYTKEQLKKWAKKKILMCPACGKPYEYCHGKVKSPYFRHMDKAECEDRFSESETEEHIIGKKDLYEWLKKQPGVTDCVLEGWIPATKQRPDIMFKYNGEQCVLEYQCSPIATEYLERHELYQDAGIKDIWILGTEKYFNNSSRKKYIQSISIGHYSPVSNEFILYEYTDFYRTLNKNKLDITTYGTYNTGIFYGRNISNYIFSNFKIRDISFDTLDQISRKRNYRKGICHKPALVKNKYLYMQKEINQEKLNSLEKYIEKKLFELSNENWNFYVNYTRSKYKVFCYICAAPNIHFKYRNFKYEKEIDRIKKDFFKKIKVWKLDSEKIYKDDNYLKELLVHIMKINKDILLSWDFQDLRILE